MSYAQAVILAANVDAVAAQSGVVWPGGRTSLIIEATSYATTTQLQVQGPSGKWINASSNLTADGLTALDLPAGTYRLNLSGGTATDIYARLVMVPY